MESGLYECFHGPITVICKIKISCIEKGVESHPLRNIRSPLCSTMNDPCRSTQVNLLTSCTKVPATHSLA